LAATDGRLRQSVLPASCRKNRLAVPRRSALSARCRQRAGSRRPTAIRRLACSRWLGPAGLALVALG